MLRMDQVHVVRHKVLVEGRSQRSVAEELGLSRNTVRKYMDQAAPRRLETKPRPRPMWDAVRERIQEVLSTWRLTRKQRLTGTRLHRQLVEEGHVIGETTVRGYLRELRRRTQEVYVPLVHRPGDAAQVDFFEVTVVVAGVTQRVWKFLMYLPCSDWTFGWLYAACDGLSFREGHVRAFEHLGGVPLRGVYDNLSSAVKRRVGLRRELQERFLALVSHYAFEPCFARPGEGHDKGAVEGRGKGVRLQHFVPVPSGPSLEALSRQLMAGLDAEFSQRRGRDSAAQGRWEEEQAALRPLPGVSFDPRQISLVEVSSQSTVRVAGATYSVPSRWARSQATAHVGVDEVLLVSGTGESILVARAPKGTRAIQYRHYLTELARKPQALRQVAPELVAELGEPYPGLWRRLSAQHGEHDAARLFAKVLAAGMDHGLDAVGAAVRAALVADRFDLLALPRTVTPQVARLEVPERLRAVEIEQRWAREYDVLLTEGGR
jgi:transposase